MQKKIKRPIRYLGGYLVSLFYKIIFFERVKLKNFLNSEEIISIYLHNPAPEQFEKIVVWFLNRNFNFVSERDVLEFLENKKVTKGSIWMTLDDGWFSNKSLIPIIEKHKIPITIFLSTSAIETGFFWSPVYVSKYKKLDDSFHKNSYHEKIRRINEIEMSNCFSPDYLSLNRKDIQEMTLSNFVTWGLHTHHHLATRFLNEKDLFEQIKLNKETVLSIVNRPIFGFAYPHGIFSGKEELVLKSLNIRYAVTNIRNRINTSTNPYLIPRYGFTSYSFTENMSRIIGCW